MSVWSAYEARLGVRGNTRREVNVNKARSYISTKLAASPSFKQVVIDDTVHSLAVIDQEDLSTKKIISTESPTPFAHGGILFWEDEPWLITEVDTHDEMYASALMSRCNYKLRWIDTKGNLIERWCIVEDGTKYLIGEKTSQIMSIGDARIAVTIGKDIDTKRITRGMRFLIDDPDAAETLAYQVTKPNRLFNLYGGKGVYRFILTEVNLTDYDNVEKKIADYYSWQPAAKEFHSDAQSDKKLTQVVEEAKTEAKNKAAEIQETKRWI